MLIKFQKGPYHKYLIQISSLDFDTRNGTVKLYGIKDDVVTLTGFSEEEFDTLCLKLAANDIVNLSERNERYG